MLRNLVRGAALVAPAVAIVMLAAAPASAHEQRTVAGKYSFVVGWGDEPTYPGYKNSVQLILSGTDEKAITDLADTLKVEVSSGGQKITLPIEANFEVGEFGTPGDYRAWIIPTRVGTYAFHITGTLHGDTIDQTFTCSDSTFDCPHNATDVQFPTKDPSASELATNVQRLNPRVNDAVAVASANKAKAESAKDDASSAQTVGIVSLIVGGVALLLGIGAFAAARRRPTA